MPTVLINTTNKLTCLIFADKSSDLLIRQKRFVYPQHNPHHRQDLRASQPPRDVPRSVDIKERDVLIGVGFAIDEFTVVARASYFRYPIQFYSVEFRRSSTGILENCNISRLIKDSDFSNRYDDGHNVAVLQVSRPVPTRPDVYNSLNMFYTHNEILFARRHRFGE